MHTRTDRSVTLSWTAPVILACIWASGCTPAKQVNPATDAEKVYPVTLDRRDNGAAAPAAHRGLAAYPATPRTLSFEMAGFAHESDTGDAQERRAAATQAAIIDAFCEALIESRRTHGLSTENFTAKPGPRLTITHCTTDDGHEIQIDLVSQGRETRFVVRHGQLQHPPRDLAMVHQIFRETDGDFCLLGTDWSGPSGTCLARVGCYTPAALGEALAGDVEASAGEPALSP